MMSDTEFFHDRKCTFAGRFENKIPPADDLHCAAFCTALSLGMPLQKQPWAGLRDEQLCVF